MTDVFQVYGSPLDIRTITHTVTTALRLRLVSGKFEASLGYVMKEQKNVPAYSTHRVTINEHHSMFITLLKVSSGLGIFTFYLQGFPEPIVFRRPLGILEDWCG